MATWDLLQNLDEFDFRSVTSDGTKIYFVQFGGGVEYHVFKYDTDLDTVTQISNAASFSGTSPKIAANFPGGIVGSAIQFFGGSLYVAVFTTDVGSNLRIYRYSGAGTAWTNVLTAVNPGGRFALFTTSNHIIVAPATDTSVVFDWAKYSANGTSWSDATISNTPAYINTNFPTLNVYSTTYGQTISPVFIDDSSHAVGFPDPDGPIFRWFEWNGSGSFTITHSTDGSSGSFVPADTWLRDTNYIRDILHWATDGGVIWKYAENLGDAWLTPTNHLQNATEIFPIVSIGFLEQTGDCNGDFVQLASGVWGVPEVVSGGTGGITHAVKMNDGDGFLFAALGVQSAIYGRSIPFEDDVIGAAKLYYGVNNIVNNVPIQVT